MNGCDPVQPPSCHRSRACVSDVGREVRPHVGRRAVHPPELLTGLTGAGSALLTTSCTHALEMTALLLGLRAGDEVIMPSFTFVSTANAYVLRGAVPVFVDCRPDTLNIDERAVEAAITPRTRAIVVCTTAAWRARWTRSPRSRSGTASR